ncbi:MAG: TIR domain-containing protein [Acidobacteriia bacterium]|nr:TIR domain-containing protein [Terriglobia bacterium]
MATIEKQYGIDVHARSDMKLGSLLEERGFDSLSQFLEAYRCRLSDHARKRRAFLSFHMEDRPQVQGFRLMASNPRLDIEFYDGSLQESVDSHQSTYVRSVIREKIQRCSVVVCLIGNGTAWRNWVDWELRTAYEMGKGICGVRLKDSRGHVPTLLYEIDAPISPTMAVEDVVKVIECAAARRG